MEEDLGVGLVGVDLEVEEGLVEGVGMGVGVGFRRGGSLMIAAEGVGGRSSLHVETVFVGFLTCRYLAFWSVSPARIRLLFDKHRAQL